MIQKNMKWLITMLLMLVTVIADAASLSSTSLTLVKGKSAVVKVSNIKNKMSLTNPANVVSASLSTSGKNGSIKITGLNIGNTKLSVKDGNSTTMLSIDVKPPMTLSPTSLNLTVNQSGTISISNASGEIKVSSSNSDIASASLSKTTITIKGKSIGTSTITVKDKITSLKVAVTVTSNTNSNLSGTTEGRLLASNCFQCHGTNGSGGFDSIKGKDDIYNELLEYMNGSEDPDGIMAAHIKGYTQEQLQAIANYLSNL